MAIKTKYLGLNKQKYINYFYVYTGIRTTEYCPKYKIKLKSEILGAIFYLTLSFPKDNNAISIIVF